MKIVAVQFDFPGAQSKYDTLARVLEHSVKKNCPSANFVLIKIPPPQLKGLKRCFDSNTIKLWHWQDQLKCDDEQVVFADCDMIVLHDIACAFDDPGFDIGLTTRSNGNLLTGGRLPINGGVIFVRNNAAGKEWVDIFSAVNQRMFEDPLFHQPWRDRYGGMNQAAMGYVLEKKTFSARIKKFSCMIWNSCKPEWQYIDEATKIIHIKSDVRRAVFHEQRDAALDLKYKRALFHWRTLAAEIGLINPAEVGKVPDVRLPVNQFTNYKPERIGGKVRWHKRSLTP
jgi:hypothetical protein